MLRHLLHSFQKKCRPKVRQRTRRLCLENLQTRQVFATIVVNSLVDGSLAQLAGDGFISLREALEAANTNRSVDGSVAGQSNVRDTIRFSPGLTGTVKLANGTLVVMQSVFIEGPGADKLTIDGDAKSRVFDVWNGTQNTVFRDFAIANGKVATTTGIGGGIINGGTLALERIAISNCIVGFGGGGIYNSGLLSIVDSTIANNVADFEGGGIQNAGTLTLRNSTLTGNSALAGQTSGTQSIARISSQIRGAASNRVEVAKTSTVFYEGTDSTDVVVPPVAGSVDFPSTRLGIIIGAANDFENFAAETEIDVTITVVEIDENGEIVITDTVIGSASPPVDGLVNYGLTVSREPQQSSIFLGGREYSIEADFFALNGPRPAGQTHSVLSTAKLIVGDNRPSNGGAIHNSGSLAISSSTLVGNQATSFGGGIYTSQGFGSITLDHTILAGNIKSTGVPSDFEGNQAVETSSAFNILGGGGNSGLIAGQNGNVIGANWKTIVENDGTRPLLESNGGPTKTIRPLTGSIAIDRGSSTYNSSAFPNDQRGAGFSRILDGDQNGTAVVDIGAIEFTPLRFDFGDAPNATQSGFAKSYPVLLGQNGARHKVSPSLFLGALVDDELDGVPSSNAGANAIGGDDGTTSDDEDGIQSITTILSGQAANVSSVSVTASDIGKLDAWIDFNRDGDWDDAGEKIANSSILQKGVNLVGFAVPSGVPSGNVFARFRLSSLGGLLPTGLASDGEVEDVMLPLASPSNPIDVLFQLPTAGAVEIGRGSGRVSVSSNGSVVFGSAISDANSFRLQGSPGDDTIILGNIDASILAKLSLSGQTGFDVLQFSGAGFTLDLTPRADAIVNLEKFDIRGSGANTLKLNLANVKQLTSSSELMIRHDANDEVTLDTGWTVNQPRLVNGVFLHTIKQGTSTVAIQNDRPFHNPYSALDADFSGDINPLDVLVVVNFINSKGQGQLITPISTAELTGFNYIDTLADGSVGPLDVLVIVNFLNEKSSVRRNSTGGGEGEGTLLDPLRFGTSGFGFAQQTFSNIDSSLEWKAYLDADTDSFCFNVDRLHTEPEQSGEERKPGIQVATSFSSRNIRPATKRLDDVSKKSVASAPISIELLDLIEQLANDHRD